MNVLGSHSFRLNRVRPPRFLGTSAEIAGDETHTPDSTSTVSSTRFWQSLTYDEQTELVASAAVAIFSAMFLERDPRVLAIIENQVYSRLTENRSQAALTGSDPVGSGTSSAGPWTGQNCTIVLIDIADYGARVRSDWDRRRIRRVLYQILQSLFGNADFRHADYHQEDRGDGALLVIAPHVPTSTIVDLLLGDMVTLLHQHNASTRPATRIQMRAALHVGPVVSDAHGVDGQAIIHTARLLDAPAFKRDLAKSGADLGFITSDYVYDTIIQPSAGHVDPAVFHRLRCRVKKEPIDARVYLARATDESKSSAGDNDYPSLIQGSASRRVAS